MGCIKLKENMFPGKLAISLWSCISLMIPGFFFPGFAEAQDISLAETGKPKVSIIIPRGSSHVIDYSSQELARYLKQITGASFSIEQPGRTNHVIRLERTQGLNNEGYTISTAKGNIILTGNSDRAVLFAVYAFLARLGCVWLAPGFDVYNGRAEIIPRNPDLRFPAATFVSEQPAFTYRKLNVDGGRSHNAGNLAKMIEWMPKAGYNTLMVPVNLNSNGRVVWDNWREQLIPELKKRDIILEAGGHGYQSFLNADMEGGSLFKQHPDWFGKDTACRPSPSDRLVFNTANAAAATYFTNNIVNYVKTHPEVNIFALWPPDVGRWHDCAEWVKLGTPQDRQATLANQVNAAIKRIRPDVRLEIIAYSYTSSPPASVRLDTDILVDYCPINQSFEKQVYDTASRNNAAYVQEIKAWRRQFAGTLGIYSYYRKYAWRSEPNLIPHYIQKDMQWYAGLPLHGISTMAEPGDWFTYELNHYVLGQVSWNPGVNVDSLVNTFCHGRYPGAAALAKTAYTLLEAVVPLYGSLPFTSLKSVQETGKAKEKIEQQMKAVHQAEQTVSDQGLSENLQRLLKMLEYVHLDLQIQQLKAQAKPKEEITQKIKELLGFMQRNLDAGLFILTGDNDLARFTKKYGLTNQSLLD